MGKVLKADATGGATAYVEKNLGADQAEVWLTARVYIDPDSLAAWIAFPVQAIVFKLLAADDTELTDAAVVDPVGLVAEWETNFAGPAGTATGGAWFLLELHRIAGGATELFVGGTSVISDTWADTSETRFVGIGVDIGFNAISPSLAYFDSVKVGTTRGGSDLFADDFEGGDLSAWTSTTGDVSVIDDPFGPLPPTPPLVINVAYGDDALAETPTYTDIASMCNRVSTRRGRQYLTDRTEAGTADIGFNDKDGTLDPTNSAGPFYPMNPNCPAQIQLKNAFTGNYVTIYTGLIQGCPQTIRAQGAALDRGTLPLVDLFSLLAIRELPTSVDFGDPAGTYPVGPPPQSPNTIGNITYVEQKLQDRMWAILADVGIPSSLTNIFDSAARVQQVTYSPGYTSLAALQDTADAEFPGVANLFIGKDGIINSRGRLSRSDTGPGNPYMVNTWKAGDQEAVTSDSDLALIAAGDFVIDRDINKVINTALFTPQGIADADVVNQLVTDGTSVDTYGPRSITGQSIITAGATLGPYAGDALGECFMFGQFYVDNFKDAHTRIVQATFRPTSPTKPNAEAHWNLLCNAELGDILRVTVSFPHGDGFMTEDYFIEGVSYDIELGADIPNVTMTLDLSPVYETFPDGWDPNA